MKVGILKTRSIELLLDKIEAIAVNQSVPGRLFDYGDIIGTGSGGTKEAFPAHPVSLRIRSRCADGHH